MKRLFSAGIISSIILLVFFLPTTAKGSNDMDGFNDPNTNIYGNGEYAIIGYKVDMVVNEDNTYEIEEYIEVNFVQPRHGIIRIIPIQNHIVRLDGTKSQTLAKIRDFQVDSKFKTGTDEWDKVYRIGDSKTRISGYKDYKISYKYDIGNDSARGYDELYYNLIGVNWDTTISNVTFSITMPKDFDTSKLGFSSGPFGATYIDNIYYTVDDGRVITGRYDGVLRPFEGLNVRLELPEGYFIEREPFTREVKLMIGSSVILLIVTLSTYIFFKEDKIIKTVEFYPPLEYNSAEIGFIYRGKANKKDVISLLIYLANKRYILIEESSNGFKIIKVKDYDGKNENERIFLDGLFKKGENEVSSSQLRDNFYNTTNTIVKKLNKSEMKYKIIDNKSRVMDVLLNILIVLTFLIIVITPLFGYGRADLMVGIIVLTAAALFIPLKTLKHGNNDIFLKIFIVIVAILFGGLGFLFMLAVLIYEPVTCITYLLCFILIIITCILKSKIGKRSAYGQKLMGGILGFRNFLEIAEKQRLEALVKDNPRYFYDILPYTYVLDVSDEWIEKFETINMQEADWYRGHKDFSVNSFSRSVNNTMKKANSVMTPRSSSGGSGSGGSSGGGSSGGGSGGGGGRSW